MKWNVSISKQKLKNIIQIDMKIHFVYYELRRLFNIHVHIVFNRFLTFNMHYTRVCGVCVRECVCVLSRTNIEYS